MERAKLFTTAEGARVAPRCAAPAPAAVVTRCDVRRLSGTALDVLWVTDLSGAKLSVAEATAVADRLSGLLNECQPRTGEHPQVLQCGDVCVDSSDELEECTLVRVAADARNNGQLLEIASTLSGLGLTIREADMERDAAAPPDAPRNWVFRVLSGSGKKLDYPAAAALLFLLGSAMGDRRTSRSQLSVPL